MKKKLNKVVVSALAGVMAITGVMVIQPEKSEAAINTNAIYCNAATPNTALNTDTRLCASQNNSDVNVSMDANWIASYDEKMYWVMKLQRYVDGEWVAVGRRTGYLSNNSPSNRTFTDVAIKDAKMRVKVAFYFDANRTQLSGSIITKTFIR